ncbi:MAG: HD domain-containing protein [Acidobacteria bacterium]|nr:HD domain-containing protein [Acidobacteriota bacterium]
MLLPLSVSQSWIDPGRLFPETYGIVPLVLFEILIVTAALYIGQLGIPINSQYAIQEKYRQTLARKNLVIRAGTDLAKCSSSSEIYHRVYDLLQSAVAGAGVDILQVAGDRVSVRFSPENTLTEDFSLESSPALKQCMETALPVASQHRRTGHWGDVYLEMYLPFQEEKGKDHSYFAKISRHGLDFLEEERESALLIARMAGTHLHHQREVEDKQLAWDKISHKMSILETDRSKSDLAIKLITHIVYADNVEASLRSIFDFSEKFLGAEDVLLFQIDGEETQFTLIGVRAKDPHRFQAGMNLPVAGSLMGRCFHKNNVSFRNSLKLSAKTAETPSDYPFYKKAGISSFILLPLRDPASVSGFGVLLIGSRHTEQFQLEQVEVIGQFSAELSLSLIFSYRFQELNRTLRQDEGVKHLTAEIVRLADMEALQRDLPVIIRDAFEFNFCDIYLYNAEKMELVRPAAVEMLENETMVSISLEEDKVYRQVYRTQQTHYTSRPKDDSSFNQSAPVRAERIVVPIRYNDAFLGLIDCGGQRAQAVSAPEKAHLELVADLLSWAYQLKHTVYPPAEPTHTEPDVTVDDLSKLDSLDRVEESLVRERGELDTRSITAFPEFLIQGQTLQIDPQELIKTILGTPGETGAHTITLLNAEISHLIEEGLDEIQVSDLLYRLLSFIDYPDQKISTFHLVPDLVTRLGNHLGMPESKLHYLQIAAKIYDVGKFAIPGQILYAPRELSEEERFQIQQHVNIGVQEILKNFKMFFPTLSIIKFHHERWNGTGYPWQLKEEEIPVESRILGLVDTFKALISDRPYRPRLHLKNAVEELVRGKGELFDPDIINLYLQILQSVNVT